MGEPREHHFVPRFFLRNFAFDESRSKLRALSKEGNLVVWKERSIKSIGFETDFYVHILNGRPVSVESSINKLMETPISRSDTWQKILSGHTEDLDKYDRPILYALVRHFEVRTPHYLETGKELAELAASPNGTMKFTDEEIVMYEQIRRRPEILKVMHNAMSIHNFASEFDGARVFVVRTRTPLRTTTTPAFTVPANYDDRMGRPIPDFRPFHRVLVVNPHTLIGVTTGNFDGEFSNFEMNDEMTRGFNRRIVAQFAHFPSVRHLISDRADLIEDMTWAPYQLVSDTPRKIIFRRKVAE